MGDFLISEATDDLVDGITGTDVGKESITQALAFRSATDQTGNIGDGQDGGDDALGLVGGDEGVESLIGDGDTGHVGLNGAERIVLSSDLEMRR